MSISNALSLLSFFGAISGLIRSAVTQAGNYLAWFACYVPTPSGLPAMAKISSEVLHVSLGLFVAFAAVEIAASLRQGTLASSIGDSAISLFAQVFGFQVYSLSASSAYSISSYLLNQNVYGMPPSQMLAQESLILASLPVLQDVFGLVLLEYAIMESFRMLVTAALACSIPLISSLWLFPPTRRAATGIYEGLVMLVLVSPLSAIMLTLGVSSFASALKGGNPFLCFAVGAGTLFGLSTLPPVLLRGGVSALQTSREALHRRKS
ncbi:MAG: hypothetical protein ACP5UI_00395 [Thermoprotei archaeon]|nr:hypothetical protein [TACK group archaeon]